MSASALRNGTPASRHGFGAGSGLDGNGNGKQFDEVRWSDDRKDGGRITSGSTPAVALEPHWQASIEIATD